MMQQYYDSFTAFADDLQYKCDRYLKEAAFSGGYAGDNSFSGGTVRGMGASTQPDKKNYLGRLKSKNPDLVSTMTIKGKDIKPGMITQAGEVKTAEVKYSNHYRKDMVYIMHTNDWDGFYEVDGDMEVMADPDDKSKPYTSGYLALKKKGLQESRKSMKFYEEFKLYESMWDDIARPSAKAKRAQLKEDIATRESSFDQVEIKACLDRVNANAEKYYSDVEVDKFGGSIFVSLSEEDLKKALRIGSRGGYTSGSGVTMPAQ
jgi:hypothetical protein